LAVDRRFSGKDGERQTDFIDVVAWRQTGEFVSKYFIKGQMCLVSGSLQIRDWTDKDGNKRRTAEVIADNVYFTESKKSREQSLGRTEPQGGFGGASSYSTPVVGSDFEELDLDEGDLPF